MLRSASATLMASVSLTSHASLSHRIVTTGSLPVSRKCPISCVVVSMLADLSLARVTGPTPGTLDRVASRSGLERKLSSFRVVEGGLSLATERNFSATLGIPARQRVNPLLLNTWLEGSPPPGPLRETARGN